MASQVLNARSQAAAYSRTHPGDARYNPNRVKPIDHSDQFFGLA
jgi:hypothetical protein